MYKIKIKQYSGEITFKARTKPLLDAMIAIFLLQQSEGVLREIVISHEIENNDSTK